MQHPVHGLRLVVTLYDPLPPCQEPPLDCWKYAHLEPFVDFIRVAAKAGQFTPDPAIPFKVEPCRATADFARRRALEG